MDMKQPKATTDAKTDAKTDSKTVRLLLLLKTEQVAEIDKFRRKHRFASRMECLRWLLAHALHTRGIAKAAASRP